MARLRAKRLKIGLMSAQNAVRARPPNVGPSKSFPSSKSRIQRNRRGTIFFERGYVTLNSAFIPAFQPASKCRKAVIHVDVNANSSRPQQSKNILCAIVLRSEAMAVPEGVDADNQVKGAYLLLALPIPSAKSSTSRSLCATQNFSLPASFAQKGPGLLSRSLHQARGKVGSIGAVNRHALFG